MRCFLLGLAGFFVAAVVAFLAMASYGDYAARASLSEAMLTIAPMKAEIAENILKQRGVRSAGADLKSLKEVQAARVTDYLKVTADGTVILRSAKHGQVVILEPSLRGETLAWKCVGSKPEKNIPAECR